VRDATGQVAAPFWDVVGKLSISQIRDSVVTGDDEQVDDPLPASNLVVGDKIRSAFVEPLGQRERPGAVDATIGNDSLDPPETLFDLIRNIEISYRDHEIIDAHTRASDRS
jgi:hypothetical protein